MYLLTQAIRSRLRKYPLLSQHQLESPRVLLKMATRSGMWGYGPWTWWVLGSAEAAEDDWLFAGLMESQVGVEAGLFSMADIRRLDGRTWPGVRRIVGEKHVPPTLMPVWRGLNPAKPARIMEFTFGEISNAENKFIRQCYERDLDAIDLQSIEGAS